MTRRHSAPHCQSVNVFLRIMVTRVVLSLCLRGVIANNQVTTHALTTHLGSTRQWRSCCQWAVNACAGTLTTASVRPKTGPKPVPKTVPFTHKKFDSALGFPGEGPHQGHESPPTGIRTRTDPYIYI